MKTIECKPLSVFLVSYFMHIYYRFVTLFPIMNVNSDQKWPVTYHDCISWISLKNQQVNPIKQNNQMSDYMTKIFFIQLRVRVFCNFILIIFRLNTAFLHLKLWQRPYVILFRRQWNMICLKTRWSHNSIKDYWLCSIMI